MNSFKLDAISLWQAYSSIDNKKFINKSSERPGIESTLTHYTSTLVLNSLLDTATFWASNIFYQNDSTEFVTGIKNLEKKLNKNEASEIIYNLKKINPSNSNVFTISFSNQKDMLQQWVTYAKEAGVCVELDKRLIYDSPKFVARIGSNNEISLPLEHVLKPALYTEDITLDKIKEQFNYAMNLQMSGENKGARYWENNKYRTNRYIYLLLLASYIKDSIFDIEAEVRGSFVLTEKPNTINEVQYNRKNNGMLRPYIEVVFCSNGRPMIPIRSIMVGPSSDQDIVFNSIVHRFKYGCNKIWDYYTFSRDDFFVSNYYEYFSTALKEVKDDKKITLSLDFVYKIWDEMVKRFSLEYEHEEEQINILGLLGDGKDKDWKFLKLKKTCNFKNVDVICDWIQEKNYFTKDGIWICKSKVPYIFA